MGKRGKNEVLSVFAKFSMRPLLNTDFSCTDFPPYDLK